MCKLSFLCLKRISVLPAMIPRFWYHILISFPLSNTLISMYQLPTNSHPISNHSFSASIFFLFPDSTTIFDATQIVTKNCNNNMFLNIEITQWKNLKFHSNVLSDLPPVRLPLQLSTDCSCSTVAHGLYTPKSRNLVPCYLHLEPKSGGDQPQLT